MSLKIPKKIVPGNTIGVCAPSGSFEPDILYQGIRIIESMGFKTFLPPGLELRKRYLAGDDNHRASVLNMLFADPDIDAVMCARGGFGALKLLPLLDYDLIQNHPKLFVGFSDITALLLAIRERASLQVIHGPVITSLAKSCDLTVNSLYLQLTENIPDTIDLKNGISLRPGNVKGRLAGGNLATISHMAGTAFQPDFRKCILFLEDTGEKPYKIDRMLTHLKMAGVFDGVQGVVTGSFSNCGDINMIYDILLEIFDDKNVPIMAGLDAGHGKINMSLPFSDMVELDTAGPIIRWCG